jgi:translation initiation factor 1
MKRMARKDKIPINNENPTELGNPFAHLQIDGLPPAGPEPPPLAASPASKKKTRRGRVVLRRETAHRGGKRVIVVHDFPSNISSREIEDIGRRLRNACGCGGTVRDRMIELQGDQPARIRTFLEEEGFQVAGVR